MHAGVVVRRFIPFVVGKLGKGLLKLGELLCTVLHLDLVPRARRDIDSFVSADLELFFADFRETAR